MANNNSDYTKPFSNIFELLPNVLRSDVSKAIIENGFNRFLTKPEMVDVVGVIGANGNKFQIPEIDSHRQANQLQPLIYNKIATVDHISSFKGILRESVRLGIDDKRFDEWGDALRFNFAPPIDIDKIVNFKDYYWLDSTNPQYITITNRSRKVNTIVNQAISDIPALRALRTQYLDEADHAAKLIIAGQMNVLYPNFSNLLDEIQFIQESNPLNRTVSDGWDAIDWDPIVNSNWGDPFEGLEIVSVSVSSFRVKGNFTPIFKLEPNFIFQVIDSANNTGIFQTAEAIFNDVTNETEIFVFGGSVDDAVVDGKIAVSIYDMYTSPDDLEENSADVDNGRAHTIAASADTTYSYDPLLNGNYDQNLGQLAGLDPIVPNPNGFQLQNDPWSAQNFWVHISDIPTGVNLALVRNATQPIIEYNEFILLNEWSYTKHNWQYGLDGQFNSTDAQPSDEELFAFQQGMFTAESLDLSYNSVIVNTDNFPLAASKLEIGNDISIEFTNLQLFKYYTIIGLTTVDNLLIVRVDEPLNAEAVPSDTKIHTQRFTSQGDDWTGFFNHWIYQGQSAPIPVNRQELNKSLIFGDDSFLSETEILSANGTSTVWYPLKKVTYTPNNDELRVYVNGIRQYGTFFEGYVTRTTAYQIREGGSNSELTFAPANNGAVNVGSEPLLFIETDQLTDSTLRAATRFPLPSYTVNNNSDILTATTFGKLLIDGVDVVVGDSILVKNESANPANNGIYTVVNPGGVASQFVLERSGVLVGSEFSTTIPSGEKGNAIKFRQGVGSGTIRVDVGPAALSDVGKTNIFVRTTSDIGYNVEELSLIQYRLVEQEKINQTQYPLFDIFNLDGTTAYEANSIWIFKESESNSINSNLNMRIETSTNGSYVFNQLLVEYDNGPMTAYKEYPTARSYPELRTIWRRGTNNERYVPRYVNSIGEEVPKTDVDGDWEIPSQMTHNLQHENRRTLSTIDLFQHFKSIVESQENPPGFTGDSKNRWRVIDQHNLGLGGSINEFNDGFDTFISSTFITDVTMVTLLQFIRNRYDNQLNLIKQSFESMIDELLSVDTIEGITFFQNYVNEALINQYENNARRDVIFGDSTTYNNSTKKGVRGWVPTLPFIGLLEKSIPKLLVDPNINLTEIRHHDGHTSTPRFDNARRSRMVANVLKNTNASQGLLSERLSLNVVPFGQVYYATDTLTLYKNKLTRRGPLTPSSDPVGIYWYDTANNELKRKVSDTVFQSVPEDEVWYEIDFNNMHASVVLEIERRLYDAVPDLGLTYDITQTLSNPNIVEQEKRQFISFTKDFNLINPYVGDYSANSAFTWNYGSTAISNLNIVAQPEEWDGVIPSRWYELYSTLYGTRYPHLEPWVIQGYSTKPMWWDLEYAGTTRSWSLDMWTNILAAIVPAGYAYPNGEISLASTVDGTTNGLTIHNVIPVNVTDTPINGEYAPDALLPPYFDSSNSTAVNFGRLITVPPTPSQASAPYPFGTRGPIEDTWRRSSTYLYDLTEIAYIDQPIRFVHYTMGNDFAEVDGLTVDVNLNKVFSHKDTVFHGQIVNNKPIQIRGLNQWYVQYLRFNTLDINTSDFRSMWLDWTPNLAYQTSSFLDVDSLSLATDSQFFDGSDYKVLTKRTPAIRNHYIDSLKMVVNKVGSFRSVGGLRIPDGDGSDWKFRITTPNPGIQDVVLYDITNIEDGQFQALRGKTTITTWFHFAIDRSKTLSFSPGDVVEDLGPRFAGIQGLVNFIDCYVAYLEDQGFKFNSSEYAIIDVENGKNISWQLEIEKMIDQIYNGMSSDQLPVEFFGLWNYVFANSQSNEFSVTGSKPLSLRNGDQVQLSTTGILPAPFKRESVYYVVNAGISTIQLSQLKNGTPITIQSSGQGVHSIGMNRFDVASPATLYEINPFRNQLIFQHDIGVVSNVHSGSFVDIRNQQGIYDQYGRALKPHQVNTFRSDKQTRIIVQPGIQNDVVVLDPVDPSGQNNLHVGGMHLFVDGYEHVVILNSRTLEGNLLFDEFLGSSIRKINARFRRQEVRTFRPNVGGYIVDDDSLRLNFEGSAQELQQIYDTHVADENSALTIAARNLIGFERKDYFDNMGITPKSQMLFHRGVIQHKGSTNAIKAFINSRQFIDASVDEFWAYKVGEYGDSRKINYPEVVLNSRDTNNDKLSLEFPIGGDSVTKNFIPITLQQTERWYNQPAQISEIFNNTPNMFFESEITAVFTISGTDTGNRIHELPTISAGVKITIPQKNETGQISVTGTEATFTLNNPAIPQTACLELSVLHDGKWYPQPIYTIESQVVTLTSFVDATGNIQQFSIGDVVSYNLKTAVLVEGIHYGHINAQFIEFNDDIADFSIYDTITIYCLNPAKSKLNPVKFIDFETETNVLTIPLWDPARDHHYHIAENIINFQENQDPALYTRSLVDFNINRNLAWNKAKVGQIWWDKSSLDYIPYYDKTIFPEVDRRSSEWGRLADYATVDLFEWVESPVPPSEYSDYIATLDGEFIAEPRLQLFKRDRQLDDQFIDNWVKVEDSVIKTWGFYIFNGVLSQAVIASGMEVEIFINGRFSSSSVVDVAGNISGINILSEGDKVVIISRAYSPSDEELEFNPEVEDDITINTQYRYDTEYTRIDRYNDNGTELIPKFYFWAKNTSTVHESLTIQRAATQLETIPTPFVIFDNLQRSEEYPIDGGSLILPDRFNQAIFRGMVNLVAADNRYKLRFSKNFGFRDSYTDSSPNLRSINTEWKMIRERQKFNIPRAMWIKLTEAVSGRTLSSTPVPVPSLNRVLYDAEYGSTLRYGLRSGQAFVEKARGLDVIIKSIEDPAYDIFPIDRDQFLSTYRFDTSDAIETAMNEIYNTFLPEHVNRIWFAALHEGLANNIKYTDIFKTSWIQLDGVRLLDTSGVLE